MKKVSKLVNEDYVRNIGLEGIVSANEIRVYMYFHSVRVSEVKEVLKMMKTWMA